MQYGGPLQVHAVIMLRILVQSFLRIESSECISEKPSTSVELTQDDIPGASLNEPFHGILKVRTFTPTQANG